MISKNNLVQKIFESYHPQPTRHQIPTFTNQNDYSFSTKYTPYLDQQTNKSRINGNTLVNRRRNSSSALETKQQNIKSIDQKIEAILKKHAGQKEVLQQLFVTKQNTMNTYKQQKDNQKQKVQVVTKVTQNKRSAKKQYNQVPQFRQSQILVNRPYASVKKQAKYQTNKNENNNHLDQKIKMLNQRIKKAEQQKKKLNIKFKPFDFDEALKPQYKQQRQLACLDQKIKHLITKNESFVNLDVVKTVKENKKPVYQNPPQPLGRIKHQKSSFKEQKTDLGQVPEKSSYKQVTKPKQKAMEQLLEALVEQIKLDQTLRNLKIWFTFYHSTSKWDILKQKLVNKKQYATRQLKKIFQSNIEEHNPFFKWDSIEFNQGLENLIQAYQNSTSHWQKSILNRWKKSQFKSSVLRQKIQYDRRSQVIALQDLIRFINLQKDSFFRNRDLYLIYMRLCGENKRLSYQKFLNAITQSQQ